MHSIFQPHSFQWFPREEHFSATTFRANETFEMIPLKEERVEPFQNLLATMLKTRILKKSNLPISID